MIAQSDKASAVELLSKIEFRANGNVASEALSALIQQGPLSWADTDAALQRAVLDQLVDCMRSMNTRSPQRSVTCHALNRWPSRRC